MTRTIRKPDEQRPTGSALMQYSHILGSKKLGTMTSSKKQARKRAKNGLRNDPGGTGRPDRGCFFGLSSQLLHDLLLIINVL